jgi:hypothetical protein
MVTQPNYRALPHMCFVNLVFEHGKNIPIKLTNSNQALNSQANCYLIFSRYFPLQLSLTLRKNPLYYRPMAFSLTKMSEALGKAKLFLKF